MSTTQLVIDLVALLIVVESTCSWLIRIILGQPPTRRCWRCRCERWNRDDAKLLAPYRIDLSRTAGPAERGDRR